MLRQWLPLWGTACEHIDVMHVLPLHGRHQSYCRPLSNASTDWAECVSSLSRSGVRADVEVHEGDLNRQAIAEVIRRSHDVVIKVGEEASTLRESVLGVSDAKLLQESPCSVWIVRPPRRERQPQLLLALDVAPSPEDCIEENVSLLRTVAVIAGQFSAYVSVFHASNFFAEASLRGSARWPAAEVNDLAESVAADRTERLLELVQEFDPARQWNVYLARGPADAAIVKATGILQPDLVVMGMKRRSRIWRVLCRSTTASVLERIGSSLLCIKSGNFPSTLIGH